MADFLPPSDDRHSSGKPYARITTNPKAKISVTPPLLTFGYIEIGGHSSNQYVTVINTGDKDVTLDEIVVGGSYAVSHEPLGVLKPGEEFQITVNFEPTGTGPQQGSLYVNAGAVDGNEIVRLLGTGGGEGSWTDNSLKANAQAIGVTPVDNSLGLFTGTIIPANRTVKQALQILSNYSLGLDGGIGSISTSLFDAIDEFTLKTDALLAQVAEAETFADELKTRADNAAAAILALGGEVDTLQTTVSTQGASIVNTQTSVTNVLGALATQVLLLTAQGSTISEHTTVLESFDLNLAEIETTLTTQAASISTSQSAITSLQGSVASMSTTLTAEQAKIVVNANAITALNSSVATMNTTLTTGLNNNSASIVTQGTAISTLDSAMATMNSTLTASIGANTSSITTQGTAIAGLGARYGTRLDVNGKVIGWIANNDGTSGGLDFVVDYFRIWNAAGSLSRAPFEFISGELYVKSAHIQDLSIGTNKIAVNSVTEVEVATPSFVSQSGTTILMTRDCYTIAKPTGTTYIKVTLLGTISASLIGADAYEEIEARLNVNSTNYRTFYWSGMLKEPTATNGSFTITHVFPAGSLTNGDVIKLVGSAFRTGSMSVTFEQIQCIVEYIKR